MGDSIIIAAGLQAGNGKNVLALYSAQEQDEQAKKSQGRQSACPAVLVLNQVDEGSSAQQRQPHQLPQRCHWHPHQFQVQPGGIHRHCPIKILLGFGR